MSTGLSELVADVALRYGFSGAVRVAGQPKAVVSAAFGRADRDQGIDNTPETRFGIASGTKFLTALGIGVLIDDSRLSLDTRLRDAVSHELPGVHRDVTIAQLLNHTSGVYDYLDEELIEDFENFELSIPPHELLRPRDYLPMITDGEMKFPPGQRFSYSNGGYVLLGLVIEELAGDYHQFVAERVMARAGMDSSGFFRLDQLPTRAASGYVDVDGGWRTNANSLPIVGGPDGGAFVTTGDMERLWHAFFSGAVLSPTLTEVYARGAVAAQDGVYYGRGLWVSDDGERPPVIYLVGSDAGVSFRSSCHGADIVATVISNTSNGAWPMATAIDDWIRAEIPARERRSSPRKK